MRFLRLVTLLAGLAVSSACSTVAGEPVSAPPPPVQTVLPSTTPAPSARPLVMPNIVGLSWVNAEPQLRRLGWTGLLVKAPYVARSGVVPNHIAVQNPPAGAVLHSDSPVTVWFAA